MTGHRCAGSIPPSAWTKPERPFSPGIIKYSRSGHFDQEVLFAIAKVGVSLAIVAYLVWDAMRTKGGVNVFDNLVHQPKSWDLLAAAWAVLTVGLMIVFVRWWVLLGAVGTPCRLREAVRAGFWGYLFNWPPWAWSAAMSSRPSCSRGRIASGSRRWWPR